MSHIVLLHPPRPARLWTKFPRISKRWRIMSVLRRIIWTPQHGGIFNPVRVTANP